MLMGYSFCRKLWALKVAELLSINSCVCFVFSSTLPFLGSILSSSQDILKRMTKQIQKVWCWMLLDTLLENSSWPFIRFPQILPSPHLSSWHFSGLSSSCKNKTETHLWLKRNIHEAPKRVHCGIERNNNNNNNNNNNSGSVGVVVILWYLIMFFSLVVLQFWSDVPVRTMCIHVCTRFIYNIYIYTITCIYTIDYTYLL